MKIHELARLSGVNAETIRMYRQKELLHPQRQPNGYFTYSAYNLYELLFIRKLRGANLGLETISDFYAREQQARTVKSMAQEINALDEAIRELEQRKKRLMSTLGHYMLFQDRHVPVQQIKLKSECWYIPLEWQQPESCCRQWLQHTDVMFTGIHIDPTELVPPLHSAVPYTMELGAYTDDLKRLRLPIPSNARRMPGGLYLYSFVQAGTDGTIPHSQLQPLIDYAAAHHYCLCPEQGSFLYWLNGEKDRLRMVFCFQVRVELED